QMLSHELKTGANWPIDTRITSKLYNYFYPATEDTTSNQIDRNILELQELNATVESTDETTTRVRLEGHVKMSRPFYPHHPELKPGKVDALVTGFMAIGS